MSYFFNSGWATEQSSISIATLPIGDVMDHVGSSRFSINYNHEHIDIALAVLEGYKFPKDIEEFNKYYRYREWNYVCEAMLLGVRLRLLEPNEFQKFMLGLYIAEKQPVCCCACGLTPGVWCGESFVFINYYIN
jgi:hypothetical protein